MEEDTTSKNPDTKSRAVIRHLDDPRLF